MNLRLAVVVVMAIMLTIGSSASVAWILRNADAAENEQLRATVEAQAMTIEELAESQALEECVFLIEAELWGTFGDIVRASIGSPGRDAANARLANAADRLARVSDPDVCGVAGDD